MTLSTLLCRADQMERRFCVVANGVCGKHFLKSLFRGVSRLGDGVFWYSLIALMPLLKGPSRPVEGLLASAQMLVSGGVGLLLYKILKRTLVRERPFIGYSGIECAMLPLDRYSFPSGHTLHAVLFSTIAISHVPELAVVLILFSLLIAASRVVLGLHYPSDVLVGAFLGWSIARLGGIAVHLFPAISNVFG